MKNRGKIIIPLMLGLVLSISCAYVFLGNVFQWRTANVVNAASENKEAGEAAHPGADDHGHAHGETSVPTGYHVDPGDPAPHPDHDHAAEAEAAHEESHGHGHGDAHGHGGGGRSVQFTVWTDKLEVFAEHPLVVAGEAAPFVTHVSYMQTGKPRTSGPVTFVMEKDGKSIDHAEAAPKRDGIYIPELVFPEAGEWTLQLRVPMEDGEATVSLANVLVYAGQEDAARAPDPVAPEGIGYLKEQQWKTPFRVALPQKKGEGLAIPEAAVMTDQGATYIFVELAGETFAKRLVKVASFSDGVATVEEGLSANEYVVTLGGASIALGMARGAQAGNVHAEAHPHASESTAVKLTDEQMARYKIEVAQATQGGLATSIRIPGEIKMHSARMAYVTSRVSGVVRKVYVSLGDVVEEGAPLALIESHALGEAKTAYLAAQSRQSLASVTYEREKQLHEQKISAEQDFLAAKQALAEAQIEVRNARQQLLTLGLTEEAIRKVSTEAEGAFTAYTVCAPLGGTVIKMEVIIGQAVELASHLFEIADLSTVWAELKLTQNELPLVKKGQAATITTLAGMGSAAGTISYAAPFLDAETRTAMARVELDNLTGQFSPGMAVEGQIQVGTSENIVLVPTSSVQYVGEQPCIFVMSAEGFAVRNVVTGASDERQTEIVKGLATNEVVAAQNAFHLKAELENLASGGPIGHGHAH
jgi:cobalt-zinc-cadmium efflux system membrane fusion protein